MLDGFGHVSVRSDKNPDHFLMSRSMAPGLVTANDIMEFDQRRRAGGCARTQRLRRTLHPRGDLPRAARREGRRAQPLAGRYSVQRDGRDVCGPSIHISAFLRLGAPIFDTQKDFGDTDMLIRDNKTGDALAKVLGNSGVALIRGHGFVAVADSAPVVVYRAIYTQVNARVQAEGMKLGTVKFLTPGEAEKAQAVTEATVGTAVGIVEVASRKDRIAGLLVQNR